MKRSVKWISTAVVSLCLCGCQYFGSVFVGQPSAHVFQASAKAKKAYYYKAKEKQIKTFHDLEADLKDVDFVIQPSNDGKCYLSYQLRCGNRENPLSYAVADGVLHLDGTRVEMVPYIAKGKKEVEKNKTLVTLSVPAEHLNHVRVKTAYGDVWMRKISCQGAALQTQYGDVWMNGVDIADRLLLSSEGGNLNLSDTHAGEELQMDTKFGDIAAKGLQLHSNTIVNSDSGNANISGANILGNLQVQTRYGDIIAKNTTVSGTAKINTKDGTLNLSGAEITGEVQIKTSYGDVDARGISVSGITGIQTGDGQILFSDADIRGRMSVKSGYGDISILLKDECREKLDITMKTYNGDMSVKNLSGGKKKRYKEDGWSYQRHTAGSSAKLDIVSDEGHIRLK